MNCADYPGSHVEIAVPKRIAYVLTAEEGGGRPHEVIVSRYVDDRYDGHVANCATYEAGEAALRLMRSDEATT